ncbi:hypothetical protein N5P37_009413, partial [Trichoderma harzianum]
IALNLTMAITKPRSNNKYMIGWICTLPTEWMEAMARLDDTHPSIEKPLNDTNNYIMGSIYRHNIVIAYPPNEEIGNNSAAAMVAARMKSTFPQMRFVLLVGIGSGVSSKVSLGDVVVSTSVEEEPGLVQWSMEKVEGNDRFERIGSLKQPPASLLTALTKLQKAEELSRAKKPENFEPLLKKRPRLISKTLLWNSLKSTLVSDGSTGNDSSPGVAVDADRKLQRLVLTLALAQMLREKEQNDKTQQLLSQKDIQLREIGKSFLVTRRQRRLSKRCISTQKRLLKLRQIDGLDHDCKPEDIDISRLFRWAVEDGDAEIVELLLDGGTDATVVHKHGWMPLHAAASKGYVDVIRLLLERGRVDADSKNDDGWTALQLAIERGHGDVVRPLLWKSANKDAAIAQVRWSQDNVEFVTFSHDLRLLASATTDGNIGLWNTVIGHCQETLEDPCLETPTIFQRRIRSMAFSHNSKLLASGSNCGTIKIWNTITGQYQQTLQATIEIWNLTADQWQQTLESYTGNVNSVAFSHDSNLLASGFGRMIEIWDLATGSRQKTFKGHEHYTNAVTFSNDLKLLASASDDGTVKLWNTTTGECQQTLEGHSMKACSVAFSHDSKLLASGSEYEINLWSMTTGQRQEILELAAAGLYNYDTIKVWVVPIDILRVNMEKLEFKQL